MFSIVYVRLCYLLQQVPRPRGMLCTRLMQYSALISPIQTCFMAFSMYLALVRCLSVSLSFTSVPRFSIGLRLGFLPNQSKLLTFTSGKHSLFDPWQGTQFCMNILQPWTAIWSSSLSFSISRYLTQFIIIPVGKKSPAVLLVDISHTNHVTGWMLHRSLGIGVIVSCTKKCTKLPFSLNKLLDSGFIREKKSLSHFTSPHFSYILAWLSWILLCDVLAVLQIFKLKSWTMCLLGVERCQLHLWEAMLSVLLAGASWRPNSYSPEKIVITRNHFSWSTALFRVSVNSRMLEFDNRLINRPFATRNIVASFSFRKSFLVQNQNLSCFYFWQTEFFPYFWHFWHMKTW